MHEGYPRTTARACATNSRTYGTRSATFTLPLVLANARQETSIGGTDWGMLQAGITISIIPCVLFYLLLQKYYVAGFLSGAVK